MIQNIFIPENIGNYYIFTQKIVGLHILSNYIYATVVVAYKEQRTIENCLQEAITKNNTETDEEALCNAIKALFLRIGHVDTIYTSISSSLVIFKELTLPFTSLKKIKLVMPFEIEAALPFSLDKGILDCIVTKESNDTQETYSNILIAATKRDYIEKYLMNFFCAQVRIDKVSVDILDLYELYKKVSLGNFNIEVFIYFSTDSVKLAIILNKQLKHVRNLNNSLDLNEILSQINFTLDSYLKNYPENVSKKAIIAGDQKIIQESAELIAQILNAQVEVFHAKKILSLDYIKTNIGESITNNISDCFLISLSTALSQDINSINLQSSINSDSNNTLISQIKWCIYLTISLFILLLSHSFVKSFRFQRNYNRMQSEYMKKVKSTFGLSNKSKTLKNCNKEALDKLNIAKKKWLPLSAKNKGSYLQYLYELSRNINKKEVGLDLNALTIDQDEIIINGKVKDISAVKKLEQQLKCELFTLEDPIQIPEFNSKPIRLTINKNENWL